MSRSNSITGETRAERPDEAFCLHLADRLDAAAIATVKQHADRHGTTLVDAVVAHGFLSENEAYRRFAEWMQHPFVDLHDTPVVATALRLLPERVARTREILPIAHDNRHLTYASARMFSDEVDRDVAFASGRRPRMVVVQRSQLMEALHRSYRVAQDVEKLIERIRLDETPKMEELSFQQGSESPVIELCNRIVASAIAAGASDIHVEPSADGAVVRHRIAGILEPVLNLPSIVVRGVTNRFKLMAKADIATKLKPQDGAFRIVLNKQVVDVRLSALPTIHGEKLVMRVIQGGDQVLAVDMLGYSRTAERALLAALSKPDGLVLVTGPTGSGKTTVLYAALRFLQTGRVNIVSVEDPVERQVEGVTQIAVNGKAGTSFATVLRSVMRQDPNIIMVGEIRDTEVAEIVGQAAYTGHLVLSSLHTTDAATAITRLVNLGLPPHKVAESLNAVVSQRLLRKLCRHCAIRNDEVTAVRLGAQYGIGRVAVSAGRGCDQCKQTGYLDRTAVPEILVPDDALRAAIRDGAGVQTIRKAMQASGSPTMRDAAMRLVEEGVTSIEEVNRVLSDPGSEAVAVAPAPLALVRPLARRRVLVTDDDRMTRLLVRMLLEKDGCEVIEAANGAEGMAQARRQTPDLMLVDLQMPDIDGFQMVEMIRADAGLAKVPVLVLTSDSGSEVESKVLEMGADDYLAKPFEPEVMLSRIHAAFRRAARTAA